MTSRFTATLVLGLLVPAAAPQSLFAEALPGDTTRAAAAAAEPIITDRPDFTESTASVAGGRVQLESGYTFDRAGEARSHSVGELLLRVGVGRGTELRFGFNSFSVATTPADEVSGLEDASVGLKVGLLPGAGAPGSLVPSAALLLGTSLPTGAAAFRTRELQPEAKLAISWDLAEWLAFSSNLNYAYLAEGGERFSEYGGSASFGVGLTDRLGGYAEYYGFLPRGEGREASSYLNGGLTFQFTPDFQLDARAGAGLNPVGPEYFFGIGLSRRW